MQHEQRTQCVIIIRLLLNVLIYCYVVHVRFDVPILPIQCAVQHLMKKKGPTRITRGD